MTSYDSYLDHCIDAYYYDPEDVELTLEDILLYHSLNDSDCLNSLDITGIEDYSDDAFQDMLASEAENIWWLSKQF
jgi:hypothetical protein